MLYGSLAPSDEEDGVVSPASPLGSIWFQSLDVIPVQDPTAALEGWLTENAFLSLCEDYSSKHCSLSGYLFVK